ncbi:hypothetical protein F511_39916 [Dorcoceras hygrometricum]|uniref:Uncharacterized protein n=1 Tax=Dorcoceras hygrometricum TaxID=472368 RepID=A0A2Z7D1U4_9LAMI|nr:hypothetical protein F511_39916 [Dorcoceras hygrometricum]
MSVGLVLPFRYLAGFSDLCCSRLRCGTCSSELRILVLEDERITPVRLNSLLGSVSHYERSGSLLIADVTADFIIADTALALLCQLLIVMTSLPMSSSLIPDLALLCQMLILDFFQSAMLTSSLLLAASSSRHTDVIIAESRFLFASIQQLISSFFALLIPEFYCSSSSSNLSPAFSEYHRCWSKLASA